MFNYNREAFLFNHEHDVKELEAARRSLPYHLRRNGLSDARSWLSIRVFWPAVDGVARVLGRAGSSGRLYWRRGYTRLLGMVYNTLVQLKELVPGRPSMA